jgi:hypothetical protein
VPPNGQLVQTARDTGISFGSPAEANCHLRSEPLDSLTDIKCKG